MSNVLNSGGYILIDCGGADLSTATGQTCPGLYDICAAAHEYRKPVWASGLKFEGDPVTPVAVMLTKRPGGNFIGASATLQLEVDPDDNITIHNLIPPASANARK